jgi:hypothetical protein
MAARYCSPLTVHNDEHAHSASWQPSTCMRRQPSPRACVQRAVPAAPQVSAVNVVMMEAEFARRSGEDTALRPLHQRHVGAAALGTGAWVWGRG